MKIYVKVTDDKNQTYEGIAELTKTKKQTLSKQIKIKIKGPTDILKQIYFEKFFESNKLTKEIIQKIKSKKYNFDEPAIEMSLKRAKFLKREGKRGSYSYIQKTPPN